MIVLYEGSLLSRLLICTKDLLDRFIIYKRWEEICQYLMWMLDLSLTIKTRKPQEVILNEFMFKNTFPFHLLHLWK